MAKAAFAGRSFRELIDDFGGRLTAIQQPSDLITLMTYSLSLLSAIRLSIEAGIFRRLAASSSPVPLSELARDLPHGPQPDDPESVVEREEFISRLLRAICALELVDEVGPFMYQANELTITMIDDGLEAGWMEMYDNTTGPNSTYYQQLQWVRDHGFKAPTDASDGAFQRARGIVGTSTFQHWAKDDPTSLRQLSIWMSSQQKYRLNWDSWFPVDTLFDEATGDNTVFMVDVGGGLGHDLVAFAARNPGRKMCLVNEDLPEVIRQAREQAMDPRIEFAEQNFFQPQSVKGAKIVSDLDISLVEPTLTILPSCSTICIRYSTTGQTTTVSTSSRIFAMLCHPTPGFSLMTPFCLTKGVRCCKSLCIHCLPFLPSRTDCFRLTAFDWTMLVQLSGKERSQSMWKRLVSRVGGLSVKKFWLAPEVEGPGFGEGIVEVVKDSTSGQ